MSLKVLHVLPSLAKESGGPPRVVMALIEALGKRDIECSAFAVGSPNGGNPVPGVGSCSRIFPADWWARGWTGYSRSLARALKQSMSDFDLVHIHDLWHHPHYAAAREAARIRKPYVISPHGAMEPWAIRDKGWKKRIYMSLVQRRVLLSAAAVHAVTGIEAGHIRQCASGCPIQVIPNGIDPAEFDGSMPKLAFEERYPELAGKQVILFLGRLHPKKGLDILATAFGQAARARHDLRLVIAGPSHGGYEDQVHRALTEAGVIDKVIFTGMLDGHMRLAAFSRADLFVLPSHSEVIGIAVLEAMAAGCPVIISPGCEFPEVAECGAGFIVDTDPPKWAEAMVRSLDDPEELREMGIRGRNLVLGRYTWDRIADEYVALYRGILDSKD